MNKFVRQILFVVVVLSMVLSACAPTATATMTPPTDEPATAEPGATAAPTETAKPADGPFSGYDAPTTITVVRKFESTEKLPQGDTEVDNQFTRYLLKNFNIKVEFLWVASVADYDQKINLAIASNDLPDAMVVNLAQFSQLVKNDQLADLTDVYNTYASDTIKRVSDSTKGLGLKAVTFDGKIRAIPALTVPDDGYQLLWIRKDWLDKLGLEVPRTMDDIEAVAKAFVEKDPGGNGPGKTIGIGGPNTNSGPLAGLYADFLNPTSGQFGFDPVFFSYNAYPGFWVKDADGKAAYGSILPETKTALARLADLYKKGLIDPEIAVRAHSDEPVAAGLTGMYFGEWWNGYWPLPNAIKNNPKANWQAYAVPLDGKGMWNPHQGTPATSFVVVRKGYEHPEIAMKIINIMNRDSGQFNLDFSTYGGGSFDVPLPLVQAMYDEGEFTYKSMLDVLNDRVKPEEFADPKYDVYKLLKDDAAKVKSVKIAPFENTDIQYWTPNYSEDTTKNNIGAFTRMYSILVGDGAIYNPVGGKDKVNIVYSLTYATTPLITTKWTNLQTLESTTFLNIILGKASIDTFDQFVKDWKAQGGDDVTAEVQASIKP